MRRLSYTRPLSKLLSWFVVLLFAVNTSGQDPVFRVINKSNGLPSNSVYNLLQDKQGFIWMGHDKGLSRYDGKVFKQYESNSLQGRSLSNLSEAGGTIWCQDFTGNFYYVNKDSVIRNTGLHSFGYYKTAGVINESLLVSVVNNKVEALNVKTGEVKSYTFAGDRDPAVCFEKDKVLILGQTSQWVFDGEKISAVSFYNQSIQNIFFLKKFGGEYYAVSKNTFPVISVKREEQFLPLPLLKPGLFVQDVTVIDDLLWISTSSGAWCFGLDMKPAFGGHCFFEGRSITKILKDREGNYWFGTLDNGILFVPDINNRLYTYHNEKFTTLHLAADGQKMYVGTSSNRILQFDIFKKQFTEVFKAPTNHEVICIYEDAPTKQLAFSSDRVFFLKNGILEREITMAGKSFASINNDLFALAHSGGISLITKQNKTNAAVPQWLQTESIGWTSSHFQLTKTLSRGRSVVFNPKDSTLYAATSKGLVFFSPAGSGIIKWNGEDIYASQLVVDDTVIYAATFANGLYKISGKKTTVPITGKNKPVTKTIYRILKSEDWLWLAGDGILQRYDPETNEVITITIADGLPNSEIKDLAAINSTLFVATTDGIAELNEYAPEKNKIAPRLVINSMLVNGVPVNWEQPGKFSMKENNVEIHFSLLSFKESDSLPVEYKINNRAWQQLAPGSRVLSLSALSSGNYTVEIRGFNEDGVQSDTNSKISFSIAAPFYKQWWFLISLLLLGMMAVFIYFKWRLINEKKQNELIAQKARLEQELQQSLLASIKSQMNPHFLFNALNTIQSYIYTNEKENASQYLGKFSELTRMILDMSNKDIVPLAEEIKALRLYLELEQLRFEEKLNFQLTVDENISTETTYIHSMLIQPYIENAIKHGLLHQKDKWQLLVDFAKQDNCIIVTVDDNGVGRKRSEELNKLRIQRHQSFATNANQTRLEILNKGLKNAIALQIIDKEDENGQPAGTKVILTIPISK